MSVAFSGALGYRSPRRESSSRPTADALLHACAVAAACIGLVLGAPAAWGQSEPSAKEPAPAAVERSIWDAPEPWRTDRWYLETSLYSHHYSYDPAHDDHQNLILVEYNFTENWLAGASVFNNSFGQSSQFVYGGYRVRPFENLQQLYFKVGVGVLHGYSGEFQNKIPLNSSGFAPGIVPSMGYCINRFCSELILFGTAGFLISAGVTLP
ncbi:MAG: hypothetical protein ABI624_23155 [Casimicrobiaceae bacterium]